MWFHAHLRRCCPSFLCLLCSGRSFWLQAKLDVPLQTAVVMSHEAKLQFRWQEDVLPLPRDPNATAPSAAAEADAAQQPQPWRQSAARSGVSRQTRRLLRTLLPAGP